MAEEGNIRVNAGKKALSCSSSPPKPTLSRGKDRSRSRDSPRKADGVQRQGLKLKEAAARRQKSSSSSSSSSSGPRRKKSRGKTTRKRSSRSSSRSRSRSRSRRKNGKRSSRRSPSRKRRRSPSRRRSYSRRKRSPSRRRRSAGRRRSPSRRPRRRSFRRRSRSWRMPDIALGLGRPGSSPRRDARPRRSSRPRRAEGPPGRLGTSEPAPLKFSETLWEKPRDQLLIPLKTIGELAAMTNPGVQWTYPMADASRRCFAAYLRSPFTPDETKLYFQAIRDGTNWTQPEGPNGPIPRKTAWMVGSNCGCTYRYGRIEVSPAVYPAWMQELMTRTMPFFGLRDPGQWPNSCNLNLYDDGGMSVGWHSDDEKLFQGKCNDIQILSLSLGVKRKFELRANWPEEGEKPLRPLMLGDGDLCTMEGLTQKHYQHRVPKEANVQGPRINLTWRWVVMHTPQCPAKRMRRF